MFYLGEHIIIFTFKMASNKFQWTVAATKFLISEYESNEMLYNVKSSDNRNKRLVIYQSIAEGVNSILDGCTAADVRKKINGLRCQYLAEKAKIQKSMKSGAATDSVYEPTAYWFPMLHFLDASITPDDSECNLQIPENEKSNEENKVENIPEANNTLKQNLDEEGKSTQSPSQSRNPTKKMKTNPADSLLFQASSTMREMSKLATGKLQLQNSLKEDDFDAFGKFIVSELRAIHQNSNEYTTRMAKRKIQHVLLETWETIDGVSLPSIITISDDTTDSNSCAWTVTSCQDSLTSPVSVDIISEAMQAANVLKGSNIQDK